jgi:hypothetical protein
MEWRVRWNVLVDLLREGLETASTGADNLYLFSRLRIFPLSKEGEKKADQMASLLSLLAVMVGLGQVSVARSEIWREGRAIRKGVVRLERELERMGEEVVLEGGLEEREEEEKRVRERVRRERRGLKKLRDELNELWWDRVRLGAEGVFAGE